MLVIEDLEVAYGSSQALFGVSLDLREQEVLAMFGRNGMGKTTTINTVMGLLRPLRGRIRFAGRQIDALPPHQICRLGIGLVPEGRQVFPNLTVLENLKAFAGRDCKRAWSVASVFELFPQLEARHASPAAVLSGGEQQMLALGRALMTGPRLLLLDEATEGLAPLVRMTIWKALAALKQRGVAILVVDKNVAELSRIADRACILEKGRVVWRGTTAELRQDSHARQSFLGI